MSTTLADIAEALGVSKMTVSRAINNDPKINTATRERVLEVARQMNYRPNHLARGLATNRTFLLGLIVPDLMHSYYAEIAKGIESVARPAGYEILICNTDEDAAKEVTEIEILRHRTDGLMLASAVAPAKAASYRRLVREGLRLVLLDRNFERIACPAVVTDNVQVGRLVTEHLIRLGHRRIGHLRGPDVRVATDRLEDYQQALQAHRLPFDETLVRACGFLESDGYNVMRQWLTQGKLPTAIFAANDPVAIGVMTALLEAGINIPSEVALAGAGEIHYGSLLRVPLTTVTWDRTLMGRHAARLLIETIAGKSWHDSKQRETVIPPELIIRQSCGSKPN